MAAQSLTSRHDRAQPDLTVLAGDRRREVMTFILSSLGIDHWVVTPPDELLILGDWIESQTRGRKWQIFNDFGFKSIFKNAFMACIDSGEYRNVWLLCTMLRKCAKDMEIPLKTLVNTLLDGTISSIQFLNGEPYGPPLKQSYFTYSVAKVYKPAPGSTLVPLGRDTRVQRLLWKAGFRPKLDGVDRDLSAPMKGQIRGLIQEFESEKGSEFGGTRRRKKRRSIRRSARFKH